MKVAWSLLALFLAGCASDVPHPFPDMPERVLSLPAALLWTEPNPVLLVEIDYVEGREPSAFALDAFRESIQSVTGKREIVILPPTLLPRDDARFQGNHEWSTMELADVHNTYFDARAAEGFADDGLARIHVLSLNGYYPLVSPLHVPELQEAIGLQLADALCLFLDDPARSVIERADLPYYERKTLIHEFGHAMGLVNISIPMQRPHVAADGMHSNNDRSVMAQGHRGPFVLEQVQDGEWIPYEFDADDLADVRAFQARQPATP